MDQALDLDATAQAELIAKKELHPRELVEAAIRRIEAKNPTLNAVVTPMFELARAEADKPKSGPFAGVPFLLKDLPPAQWAGVRLTSGSRALERFVSREDSELVRRLRAAGLIILGKTNTPELGLLPTTEPALLGACKNPWDPTRTTGGSSGGSAAAVAAGLVAMAHASDGGGSIRIPASCCGLFGLKPSRGRITQGPSVGDMMNGLVNEHALTRTVRDSARLLDATHGPSPGDPYFAPPPRTSFAAALERRPARLRIAVCTTTPSGLPIDPECIAATERAGALLQSLGHGVELARPELDAAVLLQSFSVVWAAGTAQGVLQIERALGRALEASELEPLTRTLAEMGRTASAPEYLEAVAALQRVGRTLAAFLERYDLWLTPTVATPPVPLGTFDAPADNPFPALLKAGEWIPFTPLANLSGLPAMSVPFAQSAAGLPIGVHFLARYGDEATLFALAQEMEQAAPWIGRRPQEHAAQ